MKNNTLKKIIKTALDTAGFGNADVFERVAILNKKEMDMTSGGSGQDDCPKLNKRSCNPYSECGINISLKPKKRKGKKNT
jgi:hypothetical protein